MGGLGHYLEAEGIATTSISLIRLHTEKSRPPRALWVPFELGRPLGNPGDAETRLRVLRHALGLLERPGPGPVLEDWPEEQALLQDLKSILVLPMVVGGVVVGMLGFDAIREEKCWDEEDIQILRSTGDVLVHDYSLPHGVLVGR